VNVKLCGLQDEDEIEVAAEAGATHVGFVVQAPSSHRNLALEEAARLAELSPSGLRTVLVTPETDPSAIAEARETVDPDVVQASGDLDPDELADLADEGEVWKSVGLADEAHATIATVDGYAEAGARAVVLDALEAGYGGSGESIDWGHADPVRRSIAIDTVLAGGLDPTNVAEAVQAVDPWCVDVSTGIETDERNDPDKMRAFVEAAQEAQP
jgi:phosphoribosylanthranilate isomerase